jgi:predicted phosphodiesterase
MAGQEPHYLMHLGDALYNSSDDYGGDPFANWWHKYYAAFAPVLATTPHGLTFGNHDLESKLADGSRSYDAAYPPPDADSGGRWHSFVLESIRFICLDSQVYFSFPALIEAQEAWLDEQLANPEGTYSVVYCHVPPYQSSQERQSDSALMAARWGWRFAQSNHVRLVLSGHVHAYERLSVDGVTYVIAGGGGQTLYAQGESHPNSQIFRRLASYAMLDLEADEFTITAFDTAGNVIDQHHADL